MGRDLALVLNPTSGRGKAGRLRPSVEERLRALGCTVETLVSRSASHATALGSEAASRHEAVVAMGGDGMVAMVANGVLGTEAAFGIVPSGSGNDFAVHAGYPRRDPLGACSVIASGALRQVDVGRIAGGRAFLCVAGAGFDSETNRAANAITWARGTTVYVAAVLRTLARFRPAGFTIRLDGSERAFEGMFVAVGNARSYGGGMLIVPGAELDDGLFDVCAVKRMTRWTMLRLFPALFKGTHVSHRAVEIARARSVEIVADRPFTLYADGEEIGPLPMTLTVEPRALRLIVPAP